VTLEEERRGRSRASHGVERGHERRAFWIDLIHAFTREKGVRGCIVLFSGSGLIGSTLKKREEDPAIAPTRRKGGKLS